MASHTYFTSYTGIKSAKDNITLLELARHAGLDYQIANGTHGLGLLPLDGIAVLLARRLRGRTDGDKL